MTNRLFRVPAGTVVNAASGADHNAHFLGQALHMISRLRDHVERMDSGVVYAEDDLAVVMRAMLFHTRGNKVLTRLAGLFGITGVQIRLSRAPLTQPDLHLSVGCLPTPSMSDDDGSTWVPLERWASRPLARVRVGKQVRVFTWGEFLNEYANKWGGAHIDHEVPDALVALDTFETGGYALSGYLMRTAAVQCWHLGQVLLDLGLPRPEAATLEPGTILTGERHLGGEGAITEPPTDRRHLGELQWLDYTPDDLAYLMLVMPSSPARLRVQTGQLGYAIRYEPHTNTPHDDHVPSDSSPGAGSRVQRPRTPTYRPLTPADFSLGRSLRVNGRYEYFPGAAAFAAPLAGHIHLEPLNT